MLFYDVFKCFGGVVDSKNYLVLRSIKGVSGCTMVCWGAFIILLGASVMMRSSAFHCTMACSGALKVACSGELLRLGAFQMHCGVFMCSKCTMVCSGTLCQ